MASTDIFVATETFATNVDGVPVTVIKGQTRVRSGHKLMKGREAFFAPLTVHFDVEQATAAPGEVRGAADAAAKAEAEAKAEAKAEALKAATLAANAAKNAAKSEKPAAEPKAADPGDNGKSADSK